MKNHFSPSQVIVRTTKKADLIKGEFRGLYVGKKQVVSSDEVRAEMERRMTIDPQWLWKD